MHERIVNKLASTHCFSFVHFFASSNLVSVHLYLLLLPYVLADFTQEIEFSLIFEEFFLSCRAGERVAYLHSFLVLLSWYLILNNS